MSRICSVECSLITKNIEDQFALPTKTLIAVHSIESSGAIVNESIHELRTVLCKGTCSCTQHPISRFVAYGKLSHSHQTFLTNLSEADVPKDIYEALEKPEWKHLF